MKWEVLIIFGSVLVAYLVFLAVFSIIKAVVHKKRFKKELKEHEESKTINFKK